VTNGTETTVTVNAGQTVAATLSLSGDLRFCHISSLFLFETASSFIDSSIPDHKVAFREILDRLRRAAPGESLLVVGHTDEAGSPSDNDQLSQRRADSVLAILQGDVTVWENIYQTERGNAWGNNNFRTMLQEVTGSTPSQTEINRHKEISSAGAQRRFTLFTQYFDVLLGHPGISLVFDTLTPPTLACGERHILGPGNHPPSRRAEVFFFRGNVSPIVTCDEYPNWQTPCQILPPPTPTVTIASVSAIRQGQVERIQVTVNPSPLPPAASITLELSTTSGTGEAQFVTTSSRTMEITQSEVVRVRGVTKSSTVDNIRMTAKVTGQANSLAREDFTVVSTSSNPAITLSFPIVVVEKPYTNPARQPVRLGINPLTSTLTGSGIFTRSDDRIRFFKTAGTEIRFDGRDNVFTDAELNAGVTLFAAGNRPSAALDDIQLSLTFRDTARRQIGTPVTATMTAVELTLDICESRAASGIEPPPLSTNDKINVGRFVQTPDPGFQHARAMLIVRPPNPAVFNGVLELTAIDDSTVQLFTLELPGALQLPIPNRQIIQSTSIPPNGTLFFVEGLAASTFVRDTGYRLGIVGLTDAADRVAMTAFTVSLANNVLPFNTSVNRVQIEGILDANLASFDLSDLFGDQSNSLLRARVDLVGVAGNTLQARLVSRQADNTIIEILNVTLDRFNGDRFVSPQPILMIPQAIPRPDIHFHAPQDVEIIRGIAGGNLRFELLGVQTGVSQARVRGRVVSLSVNTVSTSGVNEAEVNAAIAGANRIWAQAGIELRRSGAVNNIPDPGGLNSIEVLPNNFFDNLGPERQTLFGFNSQAASVNIYYVQNITAANGEGFGSNDLNAPMAAFAAHMDIRGGLVALNTLAHELGHILLNLPRTVNGGGDEHSLFTFNAAGNLVSGAVAGVTNIMHGAGIMGRHELTAEQCRQAQANTLVTFVE